MLHINIDSKKLLLLSCILYSLPSILYPLSCNLYPVSCILYPVSCILYTVSCILYSLSQFSVHNWLYTIYVHDFVFTINCAQFSVHN